MNPPVLAYSTPIDVIRQLARYNPALKPLERVSPSSIMGLVTPLSLAYFMASHAPHLRERSSLRLLVAGGELIDTMEDGLCYGLVPALIGSKASIHIDLVGPNLMPQRTRAFETLQSAGLNATVRRYDGKVGAALAEFGSDARWDVALLSVPGMEHHHSSWFAESELPSVLQRCEVAFMTGYTAFDRIIDHLAFTLYGYDRPLSLPNSKFGIMQNDVQGMMCFPSMLQMNRNGAVTASSDVEALMDFAAKVPFSYESDELRYGLAQHLPNFRSKYVSLLNDVIADTTTGRISLLEPEGHLDVDGPGDPFAHYDCAALPVPSPEADEMERLTWCLRVVASMTLTPGARSIVRESQMQARGDMEHGLSDLTPPQAAGLLRSLLD